MRKFDKYFCKKRKCSGWRKRKIMVLCKGGEEGSKGGRHCSFRTREKEKHFEAGPCQLLSQSQRQNESAPPLAFEHKFHFFFLLHIIIPTQRCLVRRFLFSFSQLASVLLKPLNYLSDEHLKFKVYFWNFLSELQLIFEFIFYSLFNLKKPWYLNSNIYYLSRKFVKVMFEFSHLIAYQMYN